MAFLQAPRRSRHRSVVEAATADEGLRGAAWTRVGIGSTLVLRPTTLSSFLGVDSATSARTAWLVRMVGARDLALAVGTLRALEDGRAVRPWLLAQAGCDVADAVALFGPLRHGQLARGRALLLVAVVSVSAVLGLLAADAVEDD